MKKDLKSYIAHDKEFQTDLNSYDKTLSIIKEYDAQKKFEKLGFELAIKLTTNMPKTHIDIGSGNGWLLRKMSPYFEKCIGIEPSKTGSDLSLKINAQNKNVSVINKEMIEGLDFLSPKDPVFITTSTVLNHIENYYVAEFLKSINNLPEGSVVFFDERYDKNIDWNMWHVRSKDWWIKNLPTWQLLFLNIELAGYPSGIYGAKTAEILKQYNMSTLEKTFWKFSNFMHISKRFVKKIFSYFIKK